MVDVTQGTEVVRELSIAAAPETVWEFLVDSDKAKRWMGIDATLEPEAGGLYRVEVIPGTVARGTFVELDPPHRLVFTFGWEPNAEGETYDVEPGASTIEIRLEQEGDGTRLHFEHRNLPSPEAGAKHGHGWDHYLARLAEAARGGDPGRDPWVDGEMS
jgi:uncharacterized protein YndB with AHSA1/START domain